ncbi:hypothetical protein [Halogranum rubrum]|uniref:hypothetical protein n=1 Tax=Halogranum rubrum TaxID=553466 RepID=UPI000677B858|nr:hypothetical protein [Halogranum salarium]
MAGGPYLDPHPRGEDCDEHTENIAIICQQGTECFGEPVLDIINRACGRVFDYESSIYSRETKDGYQLFNQSLWSTPEEQRDAQCRLLAHSLWIVDPKALLKEELRIGFRYQLPALPDETSVFTWVDGQQSSPDDTQAEIESQYLSVRVAETVEEIESWVASYLDFQVNPNGSEQTVIEWSNEAARTIDEIRI